MGKVTSLVIHKFRNVKPGTRLEFSGGTNVVVGKNASGKTTLLNLLAEVTAPGWLASGQGPFAGEDYDIETVITDESGSFSMRCQNRRITEDAALQLTLASGAPTAPDVRSQTTYDIVLAPTGLTPLSIRVEPAGLWFQREGEKWQHPRAWPYYPYVVYEGIGSSKANLGKSFEVYRVLFVLGTNSSSGRLDESLEYFEDYLLQEFHRQREGLTPGPSRRISSSVYMALVGNREEVSQDSSAAIHGDALPFLNLAAGAMGFESADLRFDLETSRQQDDKRVKYTNLRFLFNGRGDERISNRALSYGQKRLLAFLAYVQDSRDVIIADELVNGLHHEWIQLCLDRIETRQAFLTSQNPLLMDFMQFKTKEDVRKSFILCARERSKAGSSLVWRNLTQREATEFFSAYKAGVQRVSDILLSKGLW